MQFLFTRQERQRLSSRRKILAAATIAGAGHGHRAGIADTPEVHFLTNVGRSEVVAVGREDHVSELGVKAATRLTLAVLPVFEYGFRQCSREQVASLPNLHIGSGACIRGGCHQLAIRRNIEHSDVANVGRRLRPVARARDRRLAPSGVSRHDGKSWLVRSSMVNNVPPAQSRTRKVPVTFNVNTIRDVTPAHLPAISLQQRRDSTVAVTSIIGWKTPRWP